MENQCSRYYYNTKELETAIFILHIIKYYLAIKILFNILIYSWVNKQDAKLDIYHLFKKHKYAGKKTRKISLCYQQFSLYSIIIGNLMLFSIDFLLSNSPQWACIMNLYQSNKTRV